MPLEAQTRLLRVLQEGEYTDGRRPRADPRRRPHHRRDPSRPAPADPPGAVPRGSVLSPQRRADPPAAAARAHRGHPGAGAAFLRAGGARGPAAQVARRSGDGAAAQPIAGRAMCASWKTWSAAWRRSIRRKSSASMRSRPSWPRRRAPPRPADSAGRRGPRPAPSSATSRDYFAAHKGGLPAAGLYDRVLREIERPLIVADPRRHPRQPDQGGAICSASTATPCARRSANWTSRSSAA